MNYGTNTAPVQKIGNPYLFLDRNRERNMVFYGRVSTEHEAQLSALENQIQWYDDQAKYHPNWNVVDKYIDEGITGTQAKKRPAFLKMIEDAKQGKFDLIVTREVCRFARNTVDTLVTTRELKNIGVEVYFVEDNIWTMDGDGELRLTIMATLAQEESRKVSERVKAGQQISRQNGMVYGCGNILGYDRTAGDTYRINPEQAETVRMIYDMYLYDGLSTTAIANELTRRQRLNASGKNKWTAGVVCRVLNNQTYMGLMAYGKSYSNNYLEQKRINNHDSSSYMCVKSDFEPIVSEEDWYKCQAIKAARVKETLSAANKASYQKRHHGTKENKDLWGSKLQCPCGHSFRKNRWHKNKNTSWSYGYQCYNQLNNGSAGSRIKAGLDPTGYCDQPMIADWKLDLMAKHIIQNIWIDKKDTIDSTCELIKNCFRQDTPKKVNLTGITAQIEKYKNKKNTLLDMRTDGEITKEEFASQKAKIDSILSELEKEYADMLQTEEQVLTPDLRWDEIVQTLNEVLDFSSEQIDRDIIRKMVSKIIPDGKNHFRWYLSLDGKNTTSKDVVTEGRKNHAVVSFDDGGDKPPLHIGEVITLNDLKNANSYGIINKTKALHNSEKSSPVAILHRQQ